jgi:hypothetical protein
MFLNTWSSSFLFSFVSLSVSPAFDRRQGEVQAEGKLRRENSTRNSGKTWGSVGGLLQQEQALGYLDVGPNPGLGDAAETSADIGGTSGEYAIDSVQDVPFCS